MLIVLEGVDGAGKTTLAQDLIDAHGDDGTSRLVHRGPLKGDPLIEYVRELAHYPRTDLHHLLVSDRWHVGEMVYGPLFRGVSKLSRPMHRYIEMLLDSRGALKGVVTCSYPEVVRRLEARGEDLLKPSQVGLVWDFYREYADSQSWDLLASGMDAREIIEHARALQDQTFDLDVIPSYVGPPRPDHVFVVNQVDLPYRHAATSFLLTALESIPTIDPQRFGLISMTEDLRAAETILRQPTLTTVGPLAKDALKRISTVSPAVSMPAARNMRPDDWSAAWMEKTS